MGTTSIFRDDVTVANWLAEPNQLGDKVRFVDGDWYQQQPTGLWKRLEDSDILYLIGCTVASASTAKASKRWRMTTGQRALVPHLAARLRYEGEVDPPGYIGMPCGVFVCETGQLTNTPDAMVTKSVAIMPSTNTTDVEKTVAEWVGPEMANWLQAVCAYMLVGRADEQLVILNHGTGANGKSLFWALLAEAFGDYAAFASKNTLALPTFQQAGNEHRADLATLQGKRLALVSETDAGYQLSSSAVKMMAGGTDKITARKPYASEPVSFRPQFTTVLYTNHLPVLDGGDDALWRRLRIVDWPHTYAQDPAFQRWWEGQVAALLGWVLQAMPNYLAHGLPAFPKAAVAATNEAKIENDPLGRYVSEFWEVDRTAQTRLSTVLQHFEAWAHEEGERVQSARALAFAIQRVLGVKSEHCREGNTWPIKLRTK